MVRYEWWESAFSAATVYSAFFVVLPLILLQILACAWTSSRDIVTAERWATRLILVTTLLGIPFLMFLALVCSVSIGGGMIG